MQKENKSYTKFPTRGELIDFFMKTLEIEYTNDADRKRYQRFVNEKYITIDEYNEVLAYCIDAILDELFDDDLKIEASKKFIDDFLEYYLKVVREVEVYPYEQVCIDYILVQYLYLPFLWFFHQHFMKTDINIFSSSDELPFIDIFNLLENENREIFLFIELDNITNKEKSDKTLQQDISNWLTNKNYPNMENIGYLSKIFSKHLNQNEEEIKQLFFIGKLINSISAMLEKEEIFKTINYPINQNIKKIIAETCEPKFPDIFYLGYQLALLSDIHTEKTDSMIKDFNQLYIKIKSKGYSFENMPYFALSKARFYAQQKKFKEATKYYLLALENGKNSMGKYYEFIITEGLIVSAQITREKSLTLDSAQSPFVKFYKEAYFSKRIDSIPSEISLFFLNDMKKEFSYHFKYLYPQAQSIKTPEHKIYTSFEDIEKVKLDLTKPNKQIKDKYPNPMSQLMHFAFLLKSDEVKKLLKVGANPNEMRFNDNGTALTMILSNEYHDEKRKEAIKISKLLISKMSKEALNAKLPKKRTTALSMSIELGYVDIVKLLIEKGVDVNQVVDTNDVSPLYYTLQQIHLSQEDNFEKLMRNYKEPTDKQILNRKNNLNDAHSPFLYKDCITDEEKTNRYQQMRNSHKGNSLFDSIEKILLEKEAQKYIYNKNNYYEIFDLILDCNPDLEKHILEVGHTVLIFATELNEVEIVKKLLEKGANKDARTLQSK